MPLPSDPVGLSRAGWEAAARELDLPAFRGRQIFEALHLQRKRSWDSVRVLPAGLRERLASETPLRLPAIARREESSDGSRKYGLKLSDGALVEAVFMPGEAGSAEVNEFEDARARREPESGPRPAAAARRPGGTDRVEKYTVCLSSQTGCAVDCARTPVARSGSKSTTPRSRGKK